LLDDLGNPSASSPVWKQNIKRGEREREIFKTFRIIRAVLAHSPSTKLRIS